MSGSGGADDGSDDEDSGTYDSPNDTKKRKRGRKKKGKKKREKRKKKRKKGKKKRKGKKKVEGTDSDDEELPAKMVIAGVEGISSEGERDNHYEGDSFEDENLEKFVITLEKNLRLFIRK